MVSPSKPVGQHSAHQAAVEHQHASVKTYLIVAVILAVVTYLEYHIFTVPSLRADPAFMVPTLLVLSLVKFSLVVSFFMHLKYDNSVLAKIFSFALVLAVGVMLWTGFLILHHHF